MSQPHPHTACICLVFLDDATPVAHGHKRSVLDSSAFAGCGGDICVMYKFRSFCCVLQDRCAAVRSILGEGAY